MPWQWDHRNHRGRRILLAAAAVVAAVTAVLLTSVMIPQHSHLVAAAPAKPMTVDVNGAALRGQPVKVVRRQLRHLGMDVRVRWRLRAC